MADIFLSYAREDEPRARLLAAALEARGRSVFWDRHIPHGKDFRLFIQQQLDAAGCIVVLWSKASLASKFVLDEAAEGRDDGRLVPTLIEAVKQPLGFRGLHAADLSDWHGEPGHDELERLVTSIGAIVQASVQPAGTPSLVGTSFETSVDPQVTNATTSHSDPSVPGERPSFNTAAWNPSDKVVEFVEIRAGTFTMGSDKSKDSPAQDDELPQHQVVLPAFFIARYEVTVGQYKACARDGGCKPGDEEALDGADDLPVRHVSWHEALAYCAWLEAKLKSWNEAPSKLAEALSGRRGGRALHVTLPSEAEWEKAARGTDGRIYPWGGLIDPTKAKGTSAPPPATGTNRTIRTTTSGFVWWCPHSHLESASTLARVLALA